MGNKRIVEVLERVKRLLEDARSGKRVDQEMLNQHIKDIERELESAKKDKEGNWKVLAATHDIKNILGVLSALGALKDRELLDEVKHEVDNKIKELKEDYAPEDVNLGDLVRETINEVKLLHRRDIENNKIKIEADLDNVIHKVDRFGFKTVIHNLLLNSIQNIVENDTPRKEIHISVKKRKNNEEYIEIIHEDTGTGIPEGLDPFAGKTTRKKGTGAGGRLIKRIISLHNGEISWENKKEGGVRFRIKLRRKVK